MDSKFVNQLIPLDIRPKPDTIIRVFIVYKKLAVPIFVQEQELKTPQTRRGFTVVEWGVIER